MPENEEAKKITPHGSMRSRMIMSLVAAFGASAVVVSQCDDEESEKKVSIVASEADIRSGPKPDAKVESAPEDMPYGKAPRLEVNASIPIPEFTHLQTSISFEKPKALEMDSEEFLRFSKAIGESLREGYQNVFIPSIQTNDRNARNDAVQQFVSQTAGMLATIDPRSKKEMDAFRATWNLDPFVLIDHVNAYIKPGGWYLIFGVDAGGELSLELFPIKDNTSMRIDNGVNSFQIPVSTLGKGLHLVSKGRNEAAKVDYFFKEAVVFGAESGKVVNNVRNIRPSLPNFQQENESLDETKRTIYHDILVHESAHAYVAKQFPKTGAMVDQGAAFQVPLIISGDEGTKGVYIDMSGMYPAAAFQELCAVGIQMARGINAIPDNNIMFLEAGKVMDSQLDSYMLVHKLVPIATLQSAPDSPQKRKMMDIFTTKGIINFDELKILVGMPPYTIEHTKKAGELLYRFGYGLFEKAEKGELRLVNIQQ